MTNTARTSMTAQEREALALAHAMQEAAVYLRMRCADSPQARRLAGCCLRVVDHLMPSDPRDLGDADEAGDA